MSVRKRSEASTGKDGFVLRLHFLEDIGLNRAAQLRHDAGAEAPFRGRDVHRHDDRRRTADRHRGGEIRRAEIEAVVEPDHVLDRVDRHAAFADLAEDAGGIAVDAVKRRPVERRAEALRALVRAEEMETLVRVFREHQAGEEARRLFRLLRLRAVLACRSSSTFPLCPFFS